MASEELGGLESLQVLLQQNPNSLTFGRVADALRQQGRLDEAIQLCEEGIRRHPYYVTGHIVLGKCYLQKKLFDQAEKEFKRVLMFDPKYLAAHKYYGDLMREIGWDNTCEMSYRKILQIDPLDTGVKAVIEELVHKSKSEKPEPAAIPVSRPVEPKPAREPFLPPPLHMEPEEEAPLPLSRTMEPFIPPVVEDDLELTANIGVEDDPLRYEPLSPFAAEKTPDELEQIPKPQYPTATPPPIPDVEEERFSYILDDIFQDEMGDDNNSSPELDKPAPPTGFPESRSTVTPPPKRDDNLADEDMGVIDWSEPRDVFKKPPVRRLLPPSSNRTTAGKPDGSAPPPLPPKIQTRPVDFDLDFDDAPGRPSGNAKNSGTMQPTDFDLDKRELEADQNKAAPLPAKRPPVTASKMPTRRPPPRAPENMEEPAPPSLAEREKIVTPTLGEIYAAQGQYTKAIGVFELLSKKEPNNRNYRERIEYLKKRLQETQNAE